MHTYVALLMSACTYRPSKTTTPKSTPTGIGSQHRDRNKERKHKPQKEAKRQKKEPLTIKSV